MDGLSKWRRLLELSGTDLGPDAKDTCRNNGNTLGKESTGSDSNPDIGDLMAGSDSSPDIGDLVANVCCQHDTAGKREPLGWWIASSS